MHYAHGIVRCIARAFRLEEFGWTRDIALMRTYPLHYVVYRARVTSSALPTIHISTLRVSGILQTHGQGANVQVVTHLPNRV